jgi:hypothetical protein
MRDTDWTPSIVPGDEDRDVCLVVNDFGRRGSAYCETDVEATDLETVIQDLLDGQYSNPVRVVSFNIDGRATSRPTSPRNSAGVASLRRARSRRASRAFSRGTKPFRASSRFAWSRRRLAISARIRNLCEIHRAVRLADSL